MDERDALDNCRCKLGPANTFESRLLVELVELISSPSSEASSSGLLAMRDSRFDVRVAPSSKSCAGSGGHQRDIRGSSVMAEPFRGSSEGHKRDIRGALEGHQRGIRGSTAGHSWGPCMHLLCRVRLRFRHRLPAFLLHFGRDLEELLLGRHLMRDAIMCTQTQSELLLGRHLMRDAIRRHQTASDGHQTPSDAIKHRSPRSVLARARFACTGAARQYRLG